MAAYGENNSSEYKISEVHVDVTAKDSQEARKKAFLDGQQEAFKQLLHKLTRRSDIDPDITPDSLDSLILSHTVESEKLSKVRYIADLTFHFDKAKVEKFLTEKEIEFHPYQERSILILPLLKLGDRVLLWESENIWLEAWTDLPHTPSPISFEIPEGNLQDIQDLSASEAVQKNVEEIHKLTHRYGADDVVVILYTRSPQTEETITLDDFTAWYVTSSGTVSSIPLDSQKEKISSLKEAALVFTKIFDTFIQNQWAMDKAEHKHIKAIVTIQDHAHWVSTREVLSQIPLIKNLHIESLARHQAEISFDYPGSSETLEEALRHKGFEVKSSHEGTWLIVPLERTSLISKKDQEN